VLSFVLTLLLLEFGFGVLIHPTLSASRVLTLLLLEFGFGACLRVPTYPSQCLNPSFTGIWLRGRLARTVEFCAGVLTLLLLEFGFGATRRTTATAILASGLNPSFTGIWLRGVFGIWMSSSDAS